MTLEQDMDALRGEIEPALSAFCSRKAYSAQQVLESSVGPQRIKARAQQDGRVEPRFIGLVQPVHRLVAVAEPHINQGDVGVGRRVLILPGLQVLDYPYRFFVPS